MYDFYFYRVGDHRYLHVLTHSFPTRRSSDLDLKPLVSDDRVADGDLRFGYSARRCQPATTTSGDRIGAQWPGDVRVLGTAHQAEPRHAAQGNRPEWRALRSRDLGSDLLRWVLDLPDHQPTRPAVLSCICSWRALWRA